eukprot:592854-Amphidinium_carterae.1
MLGVELVRNRLYRALSGIALACMRDVLGKPPGSELSFKGEWEGQHREVSVRDGGTANGGNRGGEVSRGASGG